MDTATQNNRNAKNVYRKGATFHNYLYFLKILDNRQWT